MSKSYFQMNRAERAEYQRKKQEASTPKPEPEDIPSILDAPIAEFEEARPLGDPDEEGDEHALEVVDAEAERLAWRASLLSRVDPEIADLISDDELKEIEAEARKKAADEKKKAALSLVRDQVRVVARADQGLIPPEAIRSEAEQRRAMEPVTFRINIPDDVFQKGKAPNLRVDGFEYENNHVYTRPRHVADSIREMVYRAHVNFLRFKTLDQHKIGDPRMEAAKVLLSRNPPPFEVTSH